MKAIYYSIVVMIFCVTTFGYSQEKSINELLLGEWVFDYEQSFSNIERSSQQYLDTISNDYLIEIQNNYRERKISFDSDGNYKQMQRDGREVTGKWEFDTEKQTIIITTQQESRFLQKVIQISGKSLLLIPIMEGNAIMIIDKWYFTKL